jgi:hypothetical protein
VRRQHSSLRTQAAPSAIATGALPGSAISGQGWGYVRGMVSNLRPRLGYVIEGWPGQALDVRLGSRPAFCHIVRVLALRWTVDATLARNQIIVNDCNHIGIQNVESPDFGPVDQFQRPQRVFIDNTISAERIEGDIPKYCPQGGSRIPIESQ